MKYKNIFKGTFQSRPNRFIANVDIDGHSEVVHVKNTGRCKELLVPGCTVYLEKSDNPERKTKYDLIAVEKQRNNESPLLINMDSQIPNGVAEEWLEHSGLFSNSAIIKREVTYKNSRFDIYVEDGETKAFMEVKGVTLENNGKAEFPDAPTERGIKHIHELMDAAKNGYKSYILFVIQMKGVKSFSPNDRTHKAFGDALRTASKSGVNVLAYDCTVTPDSIMLSDKVEIILNDL